MASDIGSRRVVPPMGMIWLTLACWLFSQLTAAFPAIAAQDAEQRTPVEDVPHPWVFRFGSVTPMKYHSFIGSVQRLERDGLTHWPLEVGPSPSKRISRETAEKIMPNVYAVYETLFKNRPAFSRDFIAKLQAEDGYLPPERSLFFGFYSEKSTYENRLKKPIAFFGLFTGTPTPSGVANGLPLRETDSRMPLEYKIPGVQLEARRLGNPVFEIYRLIKDPQTSEIDIETMARVLSQHLDYLGAYEGVLHAHTDAVGARYFKSLGLKVEVGPDKIGREEYVLSISGREFLELHPPLHVLSYLPRRARGGSRCAQLFGS